MGKWEWKWIDVIMKMEMELITGKPENKMKCEK